MNTEIFRKVSLARLSSPEQLDMTLHVTTPKTWIALLALLITVGAAILWGFQGAVATKAEGTGVIIRNGNISNVTSPSAGRLLGIKVQVGNIVHANDVIATVGQPALLEKIRIAEEQLSDEQQGRDRLRAVRGSGLQLQLESLKRQRANLEQQISDLKEQYKLVAEQVPVDDQLLAKGLITKQQTYTNRQKLVQIQGQIDTLQAQIVQLNSNEYQTQNQGLQSDMEFDGRIADIRRNLNALHKELDATDKVVSPFTGQVLEVKLVPGNLVTTGTPIISVQPDVNQFEAVVYIPANKSKSVKTGMDVELTPSTVKREEFGFIRAKVVYVADYPSTEAALMRIFENSPLAQSLASSGPVTEVRVTMVADPRTYSGYKWSSSEGAPIKITGGMMCSAQVVTREQKPITLVFPTIKEKLGLT